MKKILFIANSDRHIKLCHLPYFKMFHDNNYVVHVATNTSDILPFCDKKIKLSLTRYPFSIGNIKALFTIRKIVKQGQYDIISCHTPMGGFLGRVSIINQHLKTKVFYTAHGFHFYKGASIINWLIYYPIEKYLARYTTCLFTMNKEDYNLAKTKFSCDTYKIKGIGFDLERLKIKKEANILKQELNIQNEFIVTYIAEISKRKRQKELIKALKKIDLKKENIKILLIGDSLIKNFNHYLKKHSNIIYLGFKEDIGSYLNISDLVISSSSQEGLPLNIMEAIYFNKPIIATNIRGNKDLLNNYPNSILVNNLDELVKEIINYKNNPKLLTNNYNIERYMVENVKKDIKKIYNKYLESRLK